jgi:hypothetical protein
METALAEGFRDRTGQRREERLVGAFERQCEAIGSKIPVRAIPAKTLYSSQAKGASITQSELRRTGRTAQNRLSIDVRSAGVSAAHSGNAFCPHTGG